MDIEKSLKKYRSQLMREGLIKSLLIGLTAGFAVNLVYALFSWLFFPRLFWIGFVLLAVVTVACACFLFFTRFKPTDKSIAKRVDGEFGLSERVLTMNQFKGDDGTYILQKQREDTAEALEKVSNVKMKCAVALPLILTAAFVTALSAAMSVLPILTVAGVLPDMSEVIDIGENPESKWYKVIYAIRSGEGMLDGELEQEVQTGGNTTGVLAVPDEDWVFTYWDDGLKDPFREDSDIRGNTTYNAIFTEAVGLPFGDPSPERNGKEADDDPNKPPTDPNSGKGGSGGGISTYEPNNQVIDGETFYGDKVYDDAYDEVMAWLAQDTEIPDEIKELIINYFKSIEQ